MNAVAPALPSVTYRPAEAHAFEAAGASFSHVVKTTVFLKDMNDFTSMNEVYAKYFTAAPPARSTVQAARLPKDALVEIDVIAYI